MEVRKVMHSDVRRGVLTSSKSPPPRSQANVLGIGQLEISNTGPKAISVRDFNGAVNNEYFTKRIRSHTLFEMLKSTGPQ